MINTLRILLSIRNTININELLDSIRHLPIIGKLIGEEIYGIRFIKILATVYSTIRELCLAFLGRFFLFFGLLLFSGLFSSLYETSQGDVFLYLVLLLQLIGLFVNNVFRMNTESEYAVFYLGMDAKQCALSNLFRKEMVLFIGYVVWGIPFALLSEVKWYIALLLPFMAVGVQIGTTGLRMYIYSLKVRLSHNKKRAVKLISVAGNDYVNIFGSLFVFIGGGISVIYVFYYYSGNRIFHTVLVLFAFLGALTVLPGFHLIRRFPYGLYRIVLATERTKVEITNYSLYGKRKRNKPVKKEYKMSYDKPSSLSNAKEAIQKDDSDAASKQDIVKTISETGAKRKNTGFRYLNEIFVRRHQKVFLVRMITDCLVTLGFLMLLSFILYVEVGRHHVTGDSVVRYVVTNHPGVFPFLLFVIHSGSYLCRVMYVNCDSAMLIYGFYRKPKALWDMYRIRLRSMISYNIIPAIMMALFAVVTMILTGGENYPFQALFTVLEIGGCTVLFSVGYLTIYYLLQPYGESMTMKARIVAFLNLLVGFLLFILIFLPISAMILAVIGILLSVLYYVLAKKLIGRFGPKWFR